MAGLKCALVGCMFYMSESRDFVTVKPCGHMFCSGENYDAHRIARHDNVSLTLSRSGCIVGPILAHVGKPGAPVCPACLIDKDDAKPFTSIERGRVETGRGGRDKRPMPVTHDVFPSKRFRVDEPGDLMRMTDKHRDVPPLLSEFSQAGGDAGGLYVMFGHYKKKEDGGEPTLLLKEVVLPESGPPSDDAANAVVTLIKFFHALVVCPGSMVHVPRVTNIDQLLVQAMQDPSLDRAMLHALGTGRDLPLETPAATRDQACVFGSYVATEVLRKLANEKRTEPLHSFLAAQLDIHGTDALKAIMGKLRISASPTVLKRDMGEDLAAAADFKTKFGAFGAIIVQYDNIGMKRKGSSCGSRVRTTPRVCHSI